MTLELVRLQWTEKWTGGRGKQSPLWSAMSSVWFSGRVFFEARDPVLLPGISSCWICQTQRHSGIYRLSKDKVMDNPKDISSFSLRKKLVVFLWGLFTLSGLNPSLPLILFTVQCLVVLSCFSTYRRLSSLNFWFTAIGKLYLFFF